MPGEGLSWIDAFGYHAAVQLLDGNALRCEVGFLIRRTKWLRFFKWYVIVSAPAQFAMFVIFARRAESSREAEAMAVGMGVETVMLVGAAIVLHFVHTLFRAVTVVLDELRTTI